MTYRTCRRCGAVGYFSEKKGKDQCEQESRLTVLENKPSAASRMGLLGSSASLPDNPTDQKIEAIARNVMIGKCPSGEELLLLARGYIEALARGRRAERVIHEWVHDADQERRTT